MANDSGLNLKATELRLGLPGSDEDDQETRINTYVNATTHSHGHIETAPKEHILGGAPIGSNMINSLKAKKAEIDNNNNSNNGIYVKVSMDGAPYLRKIYLMGYKGYIELLNALEDMFNLKFGEYSENEGYKGSEHVLVYEDGDGDMMLVGDVPWEMFMSSCKRFRIMKASDVKGYEL